MAEAGHKVAEEAPGAAVPPSEHASAPLERAPKQPRLGWEGNYYLYLLAFNVSLSSAFAIFEYGPVLLGKDVWQTGCGFLFAMIVAISLVSSAYVARVGARAAIAHAAGCFGLWVIGVLSCVWVGKGSWLQWLFFLPACLVVAFAAAVGFTTLGPYVERTAAALAAEGAGATREQLQVRLTGSFAFVSSSVQSAVFLTTMALQGGLGLNNTVVLLVLFGACILALLLAALASGPPALGGDGGGERTPDCSSEMRAMAGFLSDPRVLLLAWMPISQGFILSFKTTVFDSAASAQMGEYSISVLVLIQSLLAAIFAKPFSALSSVIGKGAMMVFGACCYGAVPLLYYFTGVVDGGWWMASVFVLVGLASANYDSVCRAVFLEHFPGELASQAMAGMNLISGLATAVLFWLGTIATVSFQAGVLFVCTALTPPCYWLAARLRRRRAVKEACPDKGQDTVEPSGPSDNA